MDKKGGKFSGQMIQMNTTVREVESPNFNDNDKRQMY